MHRFVLFMTNVTAARARYDATLDGLHYYGTATSMQALILANMLAPRPHERHVPVAAGAHPGEHARPAPTLTAT
jgi:hypothetical protein